MRNSGRPMAGSKPGERRGGRSRQIMEELRQKIMETGLLPTKLKNGGSMIKCHTAEAGEPERLIVFSKPSRNCLLSIDFAITTKLALPLPQ
jgi:hypothetical protein